VFHSDVDGAGKGVPRLLGVVVEHLGERLAERIGVRPQPLVIVVSERHDESVGRDHPSRSHDDPAVIGLTLQRSGDISRHGFTLEHATEGTLDQPFEPSLEAVEHAHDSSLLGQT
jgi:hypothetical protein